MKDNAVNQTIREKLEAYVAKVRQYKPYSLHSLIIEKTWNHGQGSLALFRFYPDKKEILMNKEVSNIYDERHLNKIIDLIGADDWRLRKAHYGYPDYYNKSFDVGNFSHTY